MINGMLEASRGSLKEVIKMDVISNNLANTTVIGFKKDTISFKDALSQAGSAGPDGSSSMVIIQSDMQQGDFQSTRNLLDFAINGKGFFKVDTPDGVRFTRKGNFTLNTNGEIVTQGGHTVMGKGSTIVINGSNAVVDSLGVVTVDGSQVGQFDLVDFEDYGSLVKDGRAFFKNIGDNQGFTPLETTIKQGYVENSNVNVAEEMVSMIHSLRAFESYQKSLQVLDGIDGKAVNEAGRLR